MKVIALLFALTCLSWQGMAATSAMSTSNNWFLASLPTPNELTWKQLQHAQSVFSAVRNLRSKRNALRHLAVSASCQNAYDAMETGVTSDDAACQEVGDILGSDDVITDANLEKLCSNTCWSQLALNLENTIEKCKDEKFETVDEKDTALNIMLMGHFVHFTCIKNENDKYCATVISTTSNAEAQTEAEICALVKDAGCCFREYITFAFMMADMAVSSASDAQVLTEAEKQEIEGSIDQLEKTCSVNLDIGCVPVEGEDAASAEAQAASTWTVTMALELQIPSGALTSSNQDLFEAGLAIDIARYLKIGPGQVTADVKATEGAKVQVEVVVVAVSAASASDIRTNAAKMQSDSSWSAQLACSAIGVSPTELKVQSTTVTQSDPSKGDTTGTSTAAMSVAAAILAVAAALRQ